VIAVLFPGQGSQKPQMGLPWVSTPAWAVVEEISDALHRDVGRLLTKADTEELKATRNAQLAAFALSLTVWTACLDEGLNPAGVSAYAGHSLGEYTALVASGSLGVVPGATLVTTRGEAMQAAADTNPGMMVAVLGLDPEGVSRACEAVDGAWPANDNAPGQVVVAGTATGVAAAGAAALALGAKRVMPLVVGGAFHSPLMDPAQEKLDDALASCAFADTSSPVVANFDARPHRNGFALLLSRQLVSPVRWRESLIEMAGMGVDTFLELGPGTELSGMVKRTVEGANRLNVSSPDELGRISKLIAS